MTGFKQYFRSHLKANIRPLIYVLIVALVTTFLLGLDAQPIIKYDDTVSGYYSTLYIPVSFLCVLAYVIPVMEFSFFKKRINLDCAYSLPISRRAMGAVHYLTGLITLFGAFTSSYLVNFAMLLSRGTKWFSFSPMIAHYFLCLLLGFSLYSLMVFVFNEANTKGDGIWFMALYTFVLYFAVNAIASVFDTMSLYTNSYSLISWGVINDVTVHYQHLVEIDKAHLAVFWQTPAHVAWFIVWVAIGIGAAIGFFLTFGKRRMERTEEISDSFFGFRVLIPVYAVSGMILFNVAATALFWVIIELLALLGYTIYRRSFRYRKSDVIILGALLIFLFV